MLPGTRGLHDIHSGHEFPVGGVISNLHFELSVFTLTIPGCPRFLPALLVRRHIQKHPPQSSSEDRLHWE
jgi:hypothetical protein